MIKILLLLILTFFSGLFLSPKNIYSASKMETSQDSGFLSQTTQFNPSQTVYVKVAADNNGDSKKILNLRDNQYNLLASYNLNLSGSNQFSANFPAPSNEGYYSLEAQIESNGSKSTSVKTIKVGNPANADVKVNVSSKVEGQSVAVSENNSSQPVTIKGSPKPSPSPSVSPSPKAETSEITDYTVSPQNEDNASLLLAITRFFKRIWFFVWPFK